MMHIRTRENYCVAIVLSADKKDVLFKDDYYGSAQ